MDPIEDNLVRVLDRWSDTESGTLDRGVSLGGMWNLANLGAIPYDPDGIDGLIDEVRDNNFFSNAPQVSDRAGQLKHGMFVDGGGIQTQGDLYDFLAS